MKKLSYILGVIAAIGLHSGYGQNTQDEKAHKIMDKALGSFFDTSNVGIYFEGIAYELDNPLSIFTLPVYEVFKGGHLFISGDKYEITLGRMKSLCDGKLVVVIDEDSKSMYVDSVRRSMAIGTEEEKPDISRLLDETFGEGTLSYQRQELVRGVMCHKIAATFTNQDNSLVYYWVDVKTGKMVLMAEKQTDAFDVYWFKSTGKAPRDHDYSINIPQKELEMYYGYEVFDNRFITQQINSKFEN